MYPPDSVDDSSSTLPMEKKGSSLSMSYTDDNYTLPQFPAKSRDHAAVILNSEEDFLLDSPPPAQVPRSPEGSMDVSFHNISTLTNDSAPPSRNASFTTNMSLEASLEEERDRIHEKMRKARETEDCTSSTKQDTKKGKDREQEKQEEELATKKEQTKEQKKKEEEVKDSFNSFSIQPTPLFAFREPVLSQPEDEDRDPTIISRAASANSLNNGDSESMPVFSPVDLDLGSLEVMNDPSLFAIAQEQARHKSRKRLPTPPDTPSITPDLTPKRNRARFGDNEPLALQYSYTQGDSALEEKEKVEKQKEEKKSGKKNGRQEEVQKNKKGKMTENEDEDEKDNDAEDLLNNWSKADTSKGSGRRKDREAKKEEQKVKEKEKQESKQRHKEQQEKEQQEKEQMEKERLEKEQRALEVKHKEEQQAKEKLAQERKDAANKERLANAKTPEERQKVQKEIAMDREMEKELKKRKAQMDSDRKAWEESLDVSEKGNKRKLFNKNKQVDWAHEAKEAKDKKVKSKEKEETKKKEDNTKQKEKELDTEDKEREVEKSKAKSKDKKDAVRSTLEKDNKDAKDKAKSKEEKEKEKEKEKGKEKEKDERKDKEVEKQADVMTTPTKSDSKEEGSKSIQKVPKGTPLPPAPTSPPSVSPSTTAPAPSGDSFVDHVDGSLADTTFNFHFNKLKDASQDEEFELVIEREEDEKGGNSKKTQEAKKKEDKEKAKAKAKEQEAKDKEAEKEKEKAKLRELKGKAKVTDDATEKPKKRSKVEEEECEDAEEQAKPKDKKRATNSLPKTTPLKRYTKKSALKTKQDEKTKSESDKEGAEEEEETTKQSKSAGLELSEGGDKTFKKVTIKDTKEKVQMEEEGSSEDDDERVVDKKRKLPFSMEAKKTPRSPRKESQSPKKEPRSPKKETKARREISFDGPEEASSSSSSSSSWTKKKQAERESKKQKTSPSKSTAALREKAKESRKKEEKKKGKAKVEEEPEGGIRRSLRAAGKRKRFNLESTQDESDWITDEIDEIEEEQATPKKSKVEKKAKEDEEEVVEGSPGPSAKTRPKKSSNKNIFKGISFGFTGITKNESLPDSEQKLKALIKSHGGILLDAAKFQSNPHHSPSSKKKTPKTILISNEPHKTLKYILAVAVGIPCVHYKWITACCEKEALVSMDPHILPAGTHIDNEDPIFIDTPHTDIFRGLRIEVVGGDSEFKDGWSKVLRSTGAKVVQRLYSEYEDRVECVLCNAETGNEVILERADKLGIPVVSVTWLIQCIIQQRKLPYDGHPMYYTFGSVDSE